MLKVGIVGVGDIATSSHIQMLSEATAVKLTAVADIRKDAADEVAAKNNVKAYYDYRDLLASDVDIIIVSTPPEFHVDMGIAAVEAKKHLFIEKPVALDMEGAARLKQAVDKSGMRCQCGYIKSYWAQPDTLRRVYKSGKLGKLISLFDARIGTARLPRQALGTPREWITRKARSGGVLVECFTHEIAWIVSVGGKIDTVYASMQVTEPDPRIDIDDNHWAILNFADGGTATLGASWANPAELYGKSITGQDAAAFTCDEGVKIKQRFSGEEEIIPAEIDAPTRNMHEDFASRILDGRPNFNTLDEAIYNLKVMLAMHKSAQENAVVRVD